MKIGDKITYEGIEAVLVTNKKCEDCCFSDFLYVCPENTDGSLICVIPDSDEYGTFQEIEEESR